ncbi:MAG: hypothetical protein R3D68_20740 [Hyphomicrobiaceae bacterium]
MSSAGPHEPIEVSAQDAARRLAVVVLARLAVDDRVSLEHVARDVAPLAPAADGVAAAAWRQQIERLLSALEATGHAQRQAKGWQISDAGRASLCGYLGLAEAMPGTWALMRDGPLVIWALGLSGAPPGRRRALAKVDSLQQQILIARWHLKIKGKPSAARVRQALAMVALQRAFGDGLSHSGLDARTALSSKASRALAAQLATAPKEFGTDGRLVAALAAEAVAVRRAQPAQLRIGAIRRYLGSPARVAPMPGPTPEEPVPAVPVAAEEAPRAPAVATLQRPTPEQFAAAVKAAAAACAEGWAGNRRAFVSQVWEVIQVSHPRWGITEIEFKAMLAETHRRGLIALANADLKDKQRLKEVQASAVVYKNTVWHYVRVEDVSQ